MTRKSRTLLKTITPITIRTRKCNLFKRESQIINNKRKGK